MGIGKPVLLTDGLECSRFPDDACLRIAPGPSEFDSRSEEHTSELQSLRHLVCRLLLEKISGSYHRHSAATRKHCAESYNEASTSDKSILYRNFLGTGGELSILAFARMRLAQKD